MLIAGGRLALPALDPSQHAALTAGGCLALAAPVVLHRRLVVRPLHALVIKLEPLLAVGPATSWQEGIRNAEVNKNMVGSMWLEPLLVVGPARGGEQEEGWRTRGGAKLEHCLLCEAGAAAGRQDSL